MNRRLDPYGADRPLMTLAQRGVPAAEWNPILLWHITRDEFLLRDFLVNWVYVQFEAGAYRIRPDQVDAFLGTVSERGGVTEHTWSTATRQRVAAGLLKAAVDFGVLRGSATKVGDLR